MAAQKKKTFIRNTTKPETTAIPTLNASPVATTSPVTPVIPSPQASPVVTTLKTPSIPDFSQEKQAKNPPKEDLEKPVNVGKDAKSDVTDQPAVQSSETAKTEEKKEMPVRSEPWVITDSSSSTPEGDEGSSQKKKNIIWIGITFIFFCLGLFGGLFIFNRVNSEQDSDNKETVTNTPAPSPVADVSPTPDTTIPKTYDIKILNGSGRSGVAAGAQELLEKEGFEVASIGNADKSTYTTTIIQAKAGVSDDYLKKLQDALSTSYTLGKIEELAELEDSDIIIIVGRE